MLTHVAGAGRRSSSRLKGIIDADMYKDKCKCVWLVAAFVLVLLVVSAAVYLELVGGAS